ncbi:MAG: 30S ribosomal protein S6 [Actinobacteria bacterium]|nr:30S ribosomal protein S6 [Actinomycetota bacterium]
MRRYEMMVIIPDTLDDEAAQAVWERVKGLLDKQGGQLIDEAWWGKRTLAYEIDKRDHAYYGVLDFEASSEGLDELERLLKLSDDIVRFKTVRPTLRIRKPA